MDGGTTAGELLAELLEQKVPDVVVDGEEEEGDEEEEDDRGSLASFGSEWTDVTIDSVWSAATDTTDGSRLTDVTERTHYTADTADSVGVDEEEVPEETDAHVAALRVRVRAVLAGVGSGGGSGGGGGGGPSRRQNRSRTGRRLPVHFNDAAASSGRRMGRRKRQRWLNDRLYSAPLPAIHESGVDNINAPSAPGFNMNTFVVPQPTFSSALSTLVDGDHKDLRELVRRGYVPPKPSGPSRRRRRLRRAPATPTNLWKGVQAVIRRDLVRFASVDFANERDGSIGFLRAAEAVMVQYATALTLAPRRLWANTPFDSALGSCSPTIEDHRKGPILHLPVESGFHRKLLHGMAQFLRLGVSSQFDDRHGVKVMRLRATKNTVAEPVSLVLFLTADLGDDGALETEEDTSGGEEEEEAPEDTQDTPADDVEDDFVVVV